MFGRRELETRELEERLEIDHVWFGEKEGRETQNVWAPSTFCFFSSLPRKMREMPYFIFFPTIPLLCFMNLYFFLQVVVLIFFFYMLWFVDIPALRNEPVMVCKIFFSPSYRIYIWIKKDILHHSISLWWLLLLLLLLLYNR